MFDIVAVLLVLLIAGWAVMAVLKIIGWMIEQGANLYRSATRDPVARVSHQHGSHTRSRWGDGDDI